VLQPLVPGDVREVGQANEHGPTAQMAQGRDTEHRGQQAAQQVADAGQPAHPHKGSAAAGLLFIVGRQLAEHLLLPSVLDEGVQLLRKWRQGIMQGLRHSFLLGE
jgi:hypothetical protein